jgi:hypothetical protein
MGLYGYPLSGRRIDAPLEPDDGIPAGLNRKIDSRSGLVTISTKPAHTEFGIEQNCYIEIPISEIRAMWGVSRRKRGLRHFVLTLLRRGPRNGAEIMNDMEVMTHGWWRPSPGSVYPLLEEMVEEGSIRKLPDGRYELLALPTFDWGPHGIEPRTPQEALREIAGLTSYLEDLKRSTPGFADSVKTEIEQVADRLRQLKN